MPAHCWYDDVQLDGVCPAAMSAARVTASDVLIAQTTPSAPPHDGALGVPDALRVWDSDTGDGATVCEAGVVDGDGVPDGVCVGVGGRDGVLLGDTDGDGVGEGVGVWPGVPDGLHEGAGTTALRKYGDSFGCHAQSMMPADQYDAAAATQV